MKKKSLKAVIASYLHFFFTQSFISILKEIKRYYYYHYYYY